MAKDAEMSTISNPTIMLRPSAGIQHHSAMHQRIQALQLFNCKALSFRITQICPLTTEDSCLCLQFWVFKRDYIYIYIDLFPCLRLPFSSALRKNFKFMPFKFEETEWKKQPILKEGKVITRAIPQCDLFDSFR